MDKNKMNAKKPAGKSFNISSKVNQEAASEFDNIKKADSDKNKNTSYSNEDFLKSSQNRSNERLTSEKDNRNKNI